MGTQFSLRAKILTTIAALLVLLGAVGYWAQSGSSRVAQNAARIVQQLREGGSFVAYARQFSEASTAAVGGDLGWIRLAQLPPELRNRLTRFDILGQRSAGTVSLADDALSPCGR